MNQARLDVIKAQAAKTTIEWGNGVMDSIFSFNGGFQKYFAECHRIHYLYGIINECYWDGGLMMGGQAFDAADVYSAFHKIEHYRGFFESIDLGVKYDEPDPDDPNPDPDDPYCNPTTDPDIIIVGDDHYRAQSVPCVVGLNNITFSRPLSSADYELDVFVIATNGMMQHNLIVTSRTASGFTVSDVLRAGTLSYFAVIRI